MKWLAAWLLAPVLAWAQTPQDFAFGVPIQADGRDPLYEIVLPASVYQGSTRDDLGDVRVFNAADELVPFAMKPWAAVTEAAPATSVSYFPLYAQAGTDVNELKIAIARSANGAVVRFRNENANSGAAKLIAYLIDVSKLDRPIEALEIDWRQTQRSFATYARIDASDDLAAWTTVVSRAPLLRIDYGGERLEQRKIEFAALRAKYLRLSWPAADQQLELKSVAARTGTTQREAVRAWKDVAAAAGAKPGEYVVDLGGRFPIDRVRLALPQNNTVARVDLLSRSDPNREWRPVANTVAYRMLQQGREITSPELAVSRNSDRYWLLRVDQKGGGLGGGTLRFAAGWVPQTLVFAARGNGPFQLAYGSGRVEPAAYSIESLVPGWRSDRQPPLALAETLPERALAGPAALHRAFDYKVWGLWSALGAGVLLLAWMAWQLTRQMQAGATRPARPQDDKSAS